MGKVLGTGQTRPEKAVSSPVGQVGARGRLAGSGQGCDQGFFGEDAPYLRIPYLGKERKEGEGLSVQSRYY